MFSHFFIDRPILASVPSILITLMGLVAVFRLPISQYPEVAPPTIRISCNYPGANAQIVADTIAAPIEQQVNGVEDMLYMSSQCNNDGSYSLTVTFKVGADLNMAQVLVQNRVALAQPVLPDVVKQTGVTVRKRSPDRMFVINLYSVGGRYDQLYVSNYALIRLQDEIARLDGVGDIEIYGQRDYSMRVWLDPYKLFSRNITASDVVKALKEQNVQVAAGQIGQRPAADNVDFQYTMSALGRLTEPEEFGEIVIKHGNEGQVTRLRDVARIELGAKNQDLEHYLDKSPDIGMGVYQLPGANILATADRVKAKIKELSKFFPPGLEYKIAYDTTPFIRESIIEVFKTLCDAVLLVAIVVLAFLQNWRSALIPLIAVPVSIIGTFAAMAAMGFSLNTLSLFGLVLAIGIVVDDAIVVVEATEHHISQGMTPRAAAHQAMNEVSAPVIAIGLVLMSVFLPCVFITGISGIFFRQFALTIAVSTIFSTINSLTLSPALCAVLLKPAGGHRDPLSWLLNICLGWFFKAFNATFAFASRWYAKVVGVFLHVSVLVLLTYAGLLVLTVWAFRQLPMGFIPSQDQGYLLASIQLPDSASLSRTDVVTAKVSEIAKHTKGIAAVTSVTGQSFVMGANGSHLASMFIVLEPFEKRPTPDLSADAILQKLRKECNDKILDAQVTVFNSPPMRGIGSTGGFKLMVEDRSGQGIEDLQEVTDNIIVAGNETAKTGLFGLSTMFRANTPQLFVDIDRTKCKTMGVPLSDVFDTLQMELAGLYVNDFNQFGRSWQVNVQADLPYRMQPEDVRRLQVRNVKGNMVPIGAVAKVKRTTGPFTITRYNMFPSAGVNGMSIAGMSSGRVLETIDKIMEKHLPRTMSYEWTEMMYLQTIAGNTTGFVFGGAVVLVFLVLAGQYESWSLPLAVILIVPMCILCSVIGVALAHMDINIFTQIAFVVLVGLASKNAILIVEFAKAKHESGLSRREAVLEACRLRLRPILMTSFAFILGVLPLMISHGAGAEMRRTLGVAVFSGMLGVTLFGIFLTPIFFNVIQWYTDRRQMRHAAKLAKHNAQLANTPGNVSTQS